MARAKKVFCNHQQYGSLDRELVQKTIIVRQTGSEDQNFQKN